MIICDYCDEGNVQHDGWHDYPDPYLGEGYRVPCAIWPPRIADTEPIEGYCEVCRGPCQGH